MARTHTLGYPCIGALRELKFALEAFWRKEADEAHLQRVAGELKRERWRVQRDAGLSCITAGDFSLYDPLLSQSALLGALPDRFGFDASRLSLAQYFELARGNAQQPAMEMTKWFDTTTTTSCWRSGPTRASAAVSTATSTRCTKRKRSARR